MSADNPENQTAASAKNRSLAKRSRNLGIVALSMMIGITVLNLSWQLQWYSYDWANGVFLLSLLGALTLSVIGFVMGISAVTEKIDQLNAILGLVLNGVAFLPLCLFTAFLVFARG